MSLWQPGQYIILSPCVLKFNRCQLKLNFRLGFLPYPQRFVFKAGGGFETVSCPPLPLAIKIINFMRTLKPPTDLNTVLCTWAVSVRMVIIEMLLVSLQNFCKETNLSPLSRTKLSCVNTYLHLLKRKINPHAEIFSAYN
jgi:hypothetical protein